MRGSNQSAASSNLLFGTRKSRVIGDKELKELEIAEHQAQGGKFVIETNDFSKITTERWYNAKNQLHRENGPAITATKPNSDYLELNWRINGTYHRIGGPAVVLVIDGVREEKWYQDDQLHREDGPAFDSPTRKSWRIKGTPFRENDLPTELKITENGVVNSWLNDYAELHRENGPAVEGTIDGKPFSEWWVKGDLHREGGPAKINADGTKEWWTRGRLIPPF